MKKLLLLICFVLVSMSTFATILFISSCGKKTYTVDPSYFASVEEAESYYLELSDALCNTNTTISHPGEK